MVVYEAPAPTKIEYPNSDGLPLAESDFQRDVLIYIVEALRLYFRHRPNVYVSGNLFLYYEEGVPDSVVAPDVFIVFGVPKRKRNSYLLWREKAAPQFVLEVTSKATRAKDLGAKRGTYAFLGVKEYFLFDPTGDYLRPPLQAFQLVGQNYQPMPAQPGAPLTIHSDVLDLDWRLEGLQLRLVEPGSGRVLRSLDDAESEIERLQAELARLRGQAG
jgi:Uma2 family endonuclease